MEEGSSSASPPPSDSNPTANGTASKFLTNLPSRGLFSSTVSPSSNLGGMRIYVCDHNTAPPGDWTVSASFILQLAAFTLLAFLKVMSILDYMFCFFSLNQVIKTDQMNILIRSLTLKKQQGDMPDGSRKRASDRAADGRASTKRAMTNNQNNARQGASSSRGVDKKFQGLTVERLRALLKEKGLSPKGKKDELIERLRNASK